MSCIRNCAAAAFLGVLLTAVTCWAGPHGGGHSSGPGSGYGSGHGGGHWGGSGHVNGAPGHQGKAWNTGGKGKGRRHHHFHGRHGKRWRAGPWWTDDGDFDDDDYQDVRYLRISNQTGQDLTVYVRPEEDGPTYRWQFEPGETAYLTVDGEKLEAAEAMVWGKSSSQVWNQFKDDPLVLVSEPYRADAVGTHTLTFR